MILSVNIQSYLFLLTNKKHLLFQKMNVKIISILFGDENFWTLQLPYMKDMNDVHYVKLKKLCYLKNVIYVSIK